MATSHPGYGAVPPASPLATGTTMVNTITGQTSIWAGSSWNAASGILPPNKSAMHVKAEDGSTVLDISYDGIITTKSGTISIDQWVVSTTVMTMLIMEMSKDDELTKKYPFVREAAHGWLVRDLQK
jgi:hypothetical protein